MPSTFSLLQTLQLYLNEGFQGGETTFLHASNSARDVPCVPCRGMVLLFEHHLLHEGSALKQGRKYTVRTDVMYRPQTAEEQQNTRSSAPAHS